MLVDKRLKDYFFFDCSYNMCRQIYGSEISSDKLKVWKDLAVSKQVLMGAATDALGLDAECSTEELRLALNQAIARARDADFNIKETANKAEAQVAEFKQLAVSAESARSEAEIKVEASFKAQEQAERQLATGKSDNADAVKKAKAEVAEKQSKLKSISKALADTPENVVRKLKTLKKQKLDEAKFRGQAESSLLASKKKVAKLEAEIEAQKPVTENAGKLLEQYKALQALCQQANETITKLSDNKEDQLEIPALDAESLESLEKVLEIEAAE